MPNLENGDIGLAANTAETEDRVVALPKEEGQGHKDACDTPSPVGEP